MIRFYWNKTLPLGILETIFQGKRRELISTLEILQNFRKPKVVKKLDPNMNDPVHLQNVKSTYNCPQKVKGH